MQYAYYNGIVHSVMQLWFSMLLGYDNWCLLTCVVGMDMLINTQNIVSKREKKRKMTPAIILNSIGIIVFYLLHYVIVKSLSKNF